MVAKFDDFNSDTWVFRSDLMDEPHEDLYMYSVYWCVQTLTSVGYGDLTFAKTEAELVLCLVWMAFGVAYYTFVVGNFTSMIANNDILKEKLEVTHPKRHIDGLILIGPP